MSAGGNNYGLFAVATCVALLLKQNPSEILFEMRGHLFDCFEKNTMTNFPECQFSSYGLIDLISISMIKFTEPS